MIEILTESEIEIEETTYSDEKSQDISLNNQMKSKLNKYYLFTGNIALLHFLI